MPVLTIIRVPGQIYDDPRTGGFLGRPYEPRIGIGFEIPAQGVRIGRDLDNDLVLPHHAVARFHFRLYREEGHYVYEDIGSRNIPIYNDKPLVSEKGGRPRRKVNDGDTFGAADFYFRYYDITFSPEWRTDTALALARSMHASQEFSAMPILADALQDAGCDDPNILDHCRDPNAPHVRSCCTVGVLLGHGIIEPPNPRRTRPLLNAQLANRVAAGAGESIRPPGEAG